MEKDRYEQNHALYIISMISLVLSIAIFSFTAYLMPFLLFGWIYNIPEFVLHWREWLQLRHEMTDFGSSGLLFLLFLLLGLVAGLIAYITSNQLENQIFDIKTESRDRAVRIKRDVKETAGVLWKVVMIIILVFIAVAILEWILYVPPVQ